MRFSLLDCTIVAVDGIGGKVECSWISLVRVSESIILELAQGLDLFRDNESENFGARRRGSRPLVVPELGQQARLIREQAEVNAYLLIDIVVPIQVGILVAIDEVVGRVSTCFPVEEDGKSTECTVCALWIGEAVLSCKPEVKFEVVVLAIDSVL